MFDQVEVRDVTAVVFDLDGTLVDSAPDLHAAALAMLAADGLSPITFAQTRSFIGNGVPTLVARIMAAVGLPEDPDRHADMVAGFLRSYNAAPAELTTLYPGALRALQQLEALGCPMALCTNKPEAPARAILASFGLSRFLPVVIGGDTLTVKKPDPAPLRAALDRLGVEGCLYVGDSEVDAATAQASGQPFALYSGGYRKSPVAQIPHQHLFDHFKALPGIVETALRLPAA